MHYRSSSKWTRENDIGCKVRRFSALGPQKCFGNLLTDFKRAARPAQHQGAAPQLHMRHSGTRCVRKLQL